MCKRASGSTRLLYDTFTDTNGTAITAHTMDVGPGWTQVSGTWTIQSNKASAAGSGRLLAVASAGVADTTSYVQFTTPPSGNYDVGLVLRYVDSTHFWLLISEVGQLLLYEINGGVTARASGGVLFSSSTTYTLSATCSGDVITGYVDGVQGLQYTSSLFNSATSFGLNTYAGGGFTAVDVDNFEVTR